MVTTTLRPLEFEEALADVENGALFIDLRPVRSYLDVHIPGSIPLVYEFGPGMASRARDCLPLDIPLILLDPGGIDIFNAAAALRGKGFAVLGVVDDGVEAWGRARGTPASTEVVEGDAPAAGVILDVGDPGAEAPDGSVRIPVEVLWHKIGAVPAERPVVVVAGYGVRAALAVGILEHAGIDDVVFYRREGLP